MKYSFALQIISIYGTSFLAVLRQRYRNGMLHYHDAVVKGNAEEVKGGSK